jgi:hypothetical protein
MIRKSGGRFSEKIMFKQKDGVRACFNSVEACSNRQMGDSGRITDAPGRVSGHGLVRPDIPRHGLQEIALLHICSRRLIY